MKTDTISRLHSRPKFKLVIPLIRNNDTTKKVPIFLGGRQYIDFNDSNLYESKYEEVLRDILMNQYYLFLLLEKKFI